VSYLRLLLRLASSASSGMSSYGLSLHEAWGYDWMYRPPSLQAMLAVWASGLLSTLR
jgi:hypothetical protein